MGITISGENNNDKILASDGVIDQISGFSIVGVLTATSFHGDLIGDVTGNLTGNVTGNINNSTLLLQTGGSERIRITGNNEIGIAGANYGTSGQVLTSGGSGSAVSWTTIAAQANISNNADNRIITGGSGVNLNGESNLNFDGTKLGININSPSAPLEIRGESGTNDAAIYFRRDGNPPNDGVIGQLLFRKGTDSVAIIEAKRESAADDAYIRMLTQPTGGNVTERLRIKSDGELVINHTQSSAPLNNTFLSIYDANSDSSAIDASGISKNYAMISLHNYGTGVSGDTTGIGFGAGSAFSYTKGSIAFTRSGSYGTGDLVFLTNNDQNTTMVNDTDERMRITKDGKIGINRSDPAADLHIVTTGSSNQDAVLKLGGSDGTLGLVIDYDQSGNTLSKITSNPTYDNSNALLKICVDGNNNPDQLVLNGDGKIGINIADNTSADLQVRTGSSGAGVFRLGGTSGSGVGMDVTYSNSGATSTVFKQNYRSTHASALMKFDAGYFTFHNGTAGDEILRIQSGKVGINEDNPQTTLNVRGCISTGRNVARELGTIIDISSNYSGGRNGASVINGQKNYEENTNADWITANGQRVNANLTIDLGAQYTCDRFVIYNQNEYTNNVREVKRFTLEGSNDKSSWTTLLDDECGASYAHEPNPGFSFRIPSDFTDDDEGATYRYWRFTMKNFHGSTTLGGVMELELYEVDSNNKTISEISTHHLSAQDISAQNIYHDLPAFFACKTSSLSISNQTNTVLAFTTDQGPGFDTTNGDYQNNNYRFNPKIPGYYQINMCCSVSYGALQAGQIYIYKNGSAYAFSQLYLNGGDSYDDICLTISTLVHLDGQSDYLEARAWRNGGNGGLGSGFQDQQWSGYLVRHAGYRRHGDGV